MKIFDFYTNIKYINNKYVKKQRKNERILDDRRIEKVKVLKKLEFYDL